MANAASTIEIELEIRDAINRLDRLQRELTQSTQSFNKAAQATRKFEGAINKAKAGLVAFFAAISVQKLAQLSDAMTQFENRVKLATSSLVQQLAVQQQLFLVAQKTALPLEDVGQLYSRLRIAAEQLGASQRDLINLTETVGLALLASGTSAASAQGALLQLGQALNSPRVQAEEFNSLIDGMPNLLREVEKQLGLTAGGLKKFVTDGQLSNKKFFDAILASQKALTEQAKSSASTIEQANQRVANSFTSLIGSIDDKLGASKFFTGFIDGIATGIDKLSNFLGLTTQATSGRGANLDQVIRGAAPQGPQYAFPTIGAERIGASIGRFPDYVQEMKSLEEIESLEFDLLFIREDQAKQIAKAVNLNKDTIDILGAQNVPLEEASNYLSFENQILNAIIQKRKIELQQNKENLTYLEQATNYLKEQFDLNDRTAGAIVSGISGAGPNASRATNIAQSKSFEEATAKLILSNEKVGKVIDSSFELLFEVLDPFLDLLGDLISAINRLIGALIKNATNAAEGILDTVGLGPNGYIFGGGLANDLEAAFSSSRPGGPTNQQKAFAQADSIFASIADAPSTRDQLQTTVDDLSGLIPDLGLTEIINRITQNTEEALASLNAVQEINFKTLAAAPAYLMNQIGKEIKKVNDKIAETEEKSKIVIQGLIESYIQEPLDALDNLTQSAQDQIAAIEFQNLSAEEQIQLRYDEAIATIEQQRALADLIDDEELRTQLLNSANQATQVQNELLEKQQKEIQKLNEEREREANLLRLQNIESGLQALLRDFERTIENIADLVQGLFDQVNELLFSDFNLASPQEAFALAQQTYESLLENAFDQDATEDDIKALQAFVNEYLTAARNVFKSSTAYADIFEGVLGDLTGLGLQTGFNAPIQASSNLSNDLEEMLSVLDDDFAEVVNELIVNIKAASLAFAQQQIEFITEVTEIPLTLTGDDISISTSGLGGTIELTSANFSLDSTKLDLRLLMSTSMFTVDTSRLNFGTITPTATAGIPNLGTITPTVSLNISSVTNSFNQLSAAINSAISNLIASINIPVTATNPLADTGAYAASGTSGRTNYNYSFINRDVAGLNYVGSNRSDRMNFGYEDFAADLAASYSSLGYNLATDRPFGFGTDSGSFRFFMAFKTASEAERAYQDYTGFGYTMGPKVGFRYGGIVDPMDTIPAMLSPGEFILSPETVKRYGVSNLNQLNSGDSAAINATSDPEVKRLLAELIVAVRENDTEVNVYTDMKGQTKAGIQEFRTELRERTRRQGEQYVPARYI